MIENIAFAFWAGGAIFLSFGILGVISDVIFLYWKWPNKWINTLPMMLEK